MPAHYYGDNMLKLLEITKEYKVDEESVLALHNVSIEFRDNEFVSILGPSGCGKTTLLNIIGGLDRYTSGDIQIDGVSTEEYDDVDWDTYRNQKIGFVFQSYNLIPHMNVLKNVALSLTLAGVGKEESRARAMEALRKVGLEKQAKKKPNQMSGGQMQRVAIARALVNNPDIILADEPTGALDSESGLQVMELLKEVAKDRLVIMVTHNGQLAEEYSTRIVNLKDGEIVGDTMPYDSTADGSVPADGVEVEKEYVTELVTADGEELIYDEKTLLVKPVKKKGFFQRLKERIRKEKVKEKSSMSVGTAVNLSFNNLLSKKGRTLLTSIAGSIGIIGIILVLALSGGVNGYIHTLEENALSQYPITIKRQDLDLAAVLDMMSSQNGNNNPEFPDDGQINISKMLGLILKENIFGENDLAALKSYIDENFDESLGVVKYDYGTTFNVYAQDPKKPDKYMKVNPFTDGMNEVLGGLDLGSMLGGLSDLASAFTATWDELSTNQKLLDQQYDVIGGRWPQTANEVVVVVDSRNQLPDYAMFMLGIKSTSDIAGAITGSDTFYEPFSIDDLLNLEYKLMSDADYYYQNEDGSFSYYPRTTLDKSVIDQCDGINIDVVGVIRPRPGVSVTSVNGVIGYTKALTLEMLRRIETNQAVAAQLNAYESAQMPEITDQFIKYQSALDVNFRTSITLEVKNEETGKYEAKEFTGIRAGETVFSEELHEKIVTELGVADVDNPFTIKIYCSSFENKGEIEAFLDRYTAETKNDLKYTDTLAVMMSFVEEMSTTMTNVLVGFAAISLIVSTIMIAIIIYTSVLERRKEIGVLRSLGARKKDISRVFIAESAMLGCYSGVIGIIMSLIFAAIGNVILAVVLKIPNLMIIEWWHYVAMFCVSVLLSMFAGFIPSRIAAKKDPTVALRSE